MLCVLFCTSTLEFDYMRYNLYSLYIFNVLERIIIWGDQIVSICC